MQQLLGAQGLPRVACWLGYGGLLPFVVLDVALWGAMPGLVTDATPARALIGYGAVIASFVGAVQWGVALHLREGSNSTRFVWSVIPALSGWIALLLPPGAGMLLLILTFLACWIVDVAFAKTAPPSLAFTQYIRVRGRLSIGVIGALAIAALRIFRY